MQTVFGFLTFFVAIEFLFNGGDNFKHLVSTIGQIFGVQKLSKKDKKLESKIREIAASKREIASSQAKSLYVEYNGDSEKVLAQAPNETTRELWKQIILEMEMKS